MPFKPRVLTEPYIRSLKPAPAGKRYAIADALVPGLKVRVTDKGRRELHCLATLRWCCKPCRSGDWRRRRDDACRS